jgi:uncharacterized membrane-anchored protein
MSESIPHVVSAIKAKRVEIAAQVQEAERRLAKLRAALANLDAAAVLLIPGHPEGIPRRQRYQPSKYFGRNELPRLVLEALRKAPGPLLTDEIARYVMHANGITPSAKESVIKPVIAALRVLVRRGTVTKTGAGPASRWAISV